MPPNEGASKTPIKALITYTCVVFLTLDWQKVRTAQMISSEGRKYGALGAAASAARTPRYSVRRLVGTHSFGLVWRYMRGIWPTTSRPGSATQLRAL